MGKGANIYSRLRWALIPAITVHNFEEWLTFPRAERGSGKTLETLGIGLQSSSWEVTQLALILVTLIAALIVVYSSSGKQKRSKDFLVCVIAGIFFANIFLPHIPLALSEGGYSPGVVTAVVINFPLCLLVWRSAIVEGLLSLQQVAVAALIGLLLLFPSIVSIMLLADQMLQLQAA